MEIVTYPLGWRPALALSTACPLYMSRTMSFNIAEVWLLEQTAAGHDRVGDGHVVVAVL